MHGVLPAPLAANDLLLQVDRNDMSTWNNKTWKLDRRGFISAKIAQSSGPWQIRANGKVKETFAAVWGKEDLVVSMDAMLLWKPWWHNNAWLPKTEGLHLDQNPWHKPQLCSVQGMVQLHAVTAETGGWQRSAGFAEYSHFLRLLLFPKEMFFHSTLIPGVTLH